MASTESVVFDCATGESVAGPRSGAAIAAQRDAVARDAELDWTLLRSQRDARLAASDWIFLPDAPAMDGATRARWLEYRQALRDLPSVTSDPASPDWPEAPDAAS